MIDNDLFTKQSDMNPANAEQWRHWQQEWSARWEVRRFLWKGLSDTDCCAS